MSTMRRLLAVLGISFALLGASTGIGHAETWHHTDPARDVVKVVQDGRTVTVADRRVGDVRTVKVRHTPTRVIVRFRTRAPLASGRWYLMVEMRSPAQDYSLYVGGSGSTRQVAFEAGPYGQRVTCPGLRLGITPKRYVVRVVVPRSCIGRPRSVRVGLAVATYVGPTTFHDDPLQRGSGHPVLSPPIRRG